MGVCMNYKNLKVWKKDVSERIDVNKTSASKEFVELLKVIIGVLKMLDLNLNQTFLINVIVYESLLMN